MMNRRKMACDWPLGYPTALQEAFFYETGTFGLLPDEKTAKATARSLRTFLNRLEEEPLSGSYFCVKSHAYRTRLTPQPNGQWLLQLDRRPRIYLFK